MNDIVQTLATYADHVINENYKLIWIVKFKEIAFYIYHNIDTIPAKERDKILESVLVIQEGIKNHTSKENRENIQLLCCMILLTLRNSHVNLT